MYAIRRLFIPPAPETQGELDIHSKWFLINDQSIVIGDYLHSDGLRTLVCSTNECLQILSRAETIHGDGTFRITPYLWYQVFIIHASVGPNSICFATTRIIVRLLYLIYLSLDSKPVDYYNFKKDGKRLNRDDQKQLVRLDPGTPYNCHKSVRSAVVINLLEQLETERIIWINEDEPIEVW
ncbi:uncharacterized protein LOC111706240 [Eurytemora carolleeae]|uniref:uncharacterized protein LOC111706240 n=1 Tax=Eurytemora carolleeae TaxID=1294199 RepID=UPI000C772D79|nr:uncharacterized protein LOC111706240 [Eurytemora carolleeae]|eukprot:XP_023334830.1 uncharacterized protein LOC111706240 [Eurytemora affinis]